MDRQTTINPTNQEQTSKGTVIDNGNHDKEYDDKYCGDICKRFTKRHLNIGNQGVSANTSNSGPLDHEQGPGCNKITNQNQNRSYQQVSHHHLLLFDLTSHI